MNNSDSFILIPGSVIDDGKLHGSYMILYSYILLLSQRSGYCFASNGYLARRFNKTPRTIGRWLSGLKELGYISIREEKNEENGRRQRRIYPRDTDKSVEGGMTGMSMANGQKCLRGYDKNVQQNNIRYNNINIYKREYISPTDPRYTLMSPTEDVASIEEKFMEAYTGER